MAIYERISDEEFDKEVEAMNAAANTSASSGNSEWAKEFNSIKYLALDNSPKAFRAVGHLPKPCGSTRNESDAMIICEAKMMTDKGFPFKLRFPDPMVDPNHLMNKVARKVLDFDWGDRPDGSHYKIMKYQESCPDIYNWVATGGFSGQAAKFNKGLETKPVVIMNVIARDDDWCEKNKHTKILAKKMNTYVPKKGDKAGQEQISYDAGISSFSLNEGVQELTKVFGNWEKYDIICYKKASEATNGKAVVKYVFENGSEMALKDYWGKMPVSEEFKKSIKTGPITDEELSYERYDLEKFFGITPYSLIYKHFKGWLERVDTAFGTEFSSECAKLANKEKEEYKAANPNNGGMVDEFKAVSEEPTYTQVETAVPERKPRVPLMEVEVKLATPKPEAKDDEAINVAALKGWSDLTAAEKGSISKVETDPDGSCRNIEFVGNMDIEACPQCGVKFPTDWTVCPSCGAKFTVS